MADYSGEQLRGHTLRIEGEPGDTDGWHLNIYDETDRQRIDNITLIKLTLTPGNVIVAQQVTLRHIDQETKRPVEEVVDVMPAQLEVSFSALVSRQSQPPYFVECNLDGQALAEELRSHRDAWENAMNYASPAIQRTLANELRMSMGMSYELDGRRIGYREEL